MRNYNLFDLVKYWPGYCVDSVVRCVLTFGFLVGAETALVVVLNIQRTGSRTECEGKRLLRGGNVHREGRLGVGGSSGQVDESAVVRRLHWQIHRSGRGGLFRGLVRLLGGFVARVARQLGSLVAGWCLVAGRRHRCWCWGTVAAFASTAVGKCAHQKSAEEEMLREMERLVLQPVLLLAQFTHLKHFCDFVRLSAFAG